MLCRKSLTLERPSGGLCKRDLQAICTYVCVSCDFTNRQSAAVRHIVLYKAFPPVFRPDFDPAEAAWRL